MQNIKQIQEIYNMLKKKSLIDAYAQARMSRNADSGGGRAYALMRVGVNEGVEILT